MQSNYRPVAEQNGKPDQNEAQPPTTVQDQNPVETSPAPMGTEAAPAIDMSTGSTDAAGTGVTGKSAAYKDQGSATDQIAECAMAETPEPTILPPATELAATEPVLPSTQVDYSTLDTKALDAAIVKSLKIASHYCKTVRC